MSDLYLFAFLFSSLIFLGVFATISRSKHMMLAVKAAKEGKSKEEVRALLQTEPDGVSIQIYRRIGKIILAGIMMYWSNSWFGYTLHGLPSDWQEPLVRSVYGFQIAVVVIILLRSLAMIVSAFTKSTVIDTIADKNSNWETLETRLLIAACLISLLAAIIPVYFIVKQA